MPNHNLAALRLKNQRISATRFECPEEVAAWMGAMQAQDYAQAVWAVGLRTRAATLADVERAIADGRLLRTWPMRGTLHFVTPRDAKWMLALSGARQTAAARGRHRQLELDAATFERAHQAFHDALNGGKRLPRPQMMQLLEQAGISTAGQRGIHIIGQAAQSGLLYIGPKEGKQHTFGLLDELVPDAKTLPREEALAELARRYFTSHGPASERDFAWWSGLTLTDARAGLAATQGLASISVEDREYWLAATALDDADPNPAGVHLLPGYDEYFIGYTDRAAVVTPENLPKIVPGGNGMFYPMLVVDGQIVGTWKRALKKQDLRLSIEPFGPVKINAGQLSEAAERYSRFLGLTLADVSIVP
jgi:hypothetical protein